MTEGEDAADVLGDWYARGGTDDPEAVIRSHPELEDSLRAGFRAAELLGAASKTPPPATPGVPRRIGDFDVVREIGRGGMGVVYEAEQRSMRRRVALKVLFPAFTSSRKAVERFRAEAQAAGRLAHPNLVAVHALGEEDGVQHYAMEWVRGRSLAQEIEGLRRARAGDAPAADEAARHRGIAASAAGAAEGLAAAHAAGVVHRDVKPSNLLLTDDGAVKVTDFGLARVEGEDLHTLTGDLLGTPSYMSPEQARGGRVPVDARTDVYSLGASLYEWLALRPPFDGDDPHRVAVRILSSDPVPLRRRAPRVPRDLATIVEKAMEKDPARRYAGAAEMAADLRAFAEGRPIVARGVGPLGRLSRRAARHRGLVALVVGVAVVAGAAGVLAARGSQEPRDARPSSLWRPRAALAGPLAALGTEFVGGRLYAIGGFASSRVARYDPAKDAWASAAELPTRLQYAGTAVVGGKLYVVGGDSAGNGDDDGLRVYDPAKGSWTTRAPMPGGPRWGVGTAEIDGRLYVVGGATDDGRKDLSRLEVYDPATDAWRTLAPAPTARGALGVAAIGGKLYAAGGTSDGKALTALEVYDPASDAWTTKAPMPVPMATRAVAVDGRLWLVGGSAEGDRAAVRIYDPAADAWSDGPPLSLGRYAHGVAYDPVTRTVYAVAGSLGKSWTGEVEAFVVPPPPPAKR